MATRRYTGPQIQFLLPHGSLRISTEILQHYLPFFWSCFYPTSPSADLREWFSNPDDGKALDMIFGYLKAIQDYNDSTALFDSLEDHWKRIRQQQSSRRWSSSSMADIFLSLGRILRPENLGCGKEISDVLSTFFIKHCEEFLRDKPRRWTVYLNTLYYIRASMDPIYSCLLQHSHVRQALESGAVDKHLDERVLDSLGGFLKGRNFRAFHKHLQKCVLNRTHGLGRHDGAIERVRLPRLRNGDEYHPHEIMDIHLNDPDRIRVIEDHAPGDQDFHLVDGLEFNRLGPIGRKPRNLLVGPRAHMGPRRLLH